MTARIAYADYGLSAPVVRLVVIDGSLCGLDCPHRVPNNGCDGFWAPGIEAVTEGPNAGRSWRCQECADTALSKSEKRAQRAFELLMRLKGVKVAKRGKKTEEQDNKAVPVTQVERRPLRCDLTDSEIVSRLDAAKTCASGIAAMRSRLKELQTEIRDKCAYREVECSIEPDYGSNTVLVTRLDTREIVERRQMTLEERQERLPMS